MLDFFFFERGICPFSPYIKIMKEIIHMWMHKIPSDEVQTRQSQEADGTPRWRLVLFKKDGHRCGACHNVSDAKVRAIKMFIELAVRCIFSEL